MQPARPGCVDARPGSTARALLASRGMTSVRKALSIGRRGAMLALAAPALATGARAQALKPVSLTLPWLAEGSNLFAHVAKAKGYFAEAGLDVTISRGFGSVAAAQAVGAGRFDFGIAAPSAALQQIAKGLPLISLATLAYDATMGIAVPADGPIRKPADLAGRTMAGTITSGEYPFLPAWAKRAGLDLAQVKLVTTDPNLRQRLLMEKQADAISGFVISMAPTFGALGFAARYMLFSGVGLPLYSNALLTQQARLRSDAATCQGMTTALLKAIRLTLLEPEEAMRLFFAAVPEAGLAPGAREQVRIGLGIFRRTVIATPPRQSGLGFTPDAGWDAMTELVMEFVAAPGDARPERAATMTNALVGGVTLTGQEWSAADATSREFAAILA
jgi:ABC-type nitrate/sulfonate/bicarbonate transport system substrate-binding protein